MESNPEEIALQREVFASVRSAIAALPQHERLVAVLFYGRCYSYNEVSTLLNIPLTTVEKRLHSARQKLKVQLKSALHEANEIARHPDDGAAEEVRLAQWLILRLKNALISWQTKSSASLNYNVTYGG